MRAFSRRLTAVAAIGLSSLAVGSAAPECQDFSGVWQTKDLALSELRIMQYGCALEGAYKAPAGGSKKKVKHTLKATASGSAATGSVTRTDPAGCKAQLFVTLALERGNLTFQTTHTDGACQLAAGFAERRDWQRIAAARSVLPFHCPNCGQALGKCGGNTLGARCTYCSSPSGQCRCPFCGGKFYEISHAHNY